MCLQWRRCVGHEDCHYKLMKFKTAEGFEFYEVGTY